MFHQRRFWLAVLFCGAVGCGGEESDPNNPGNPPGNPGGPSNPKTPFPPGVADEPFCGFGDWQNNYERLLRDDLKDLSVVPNKITDIFTNF